MANINTELNINPDRGLKTNVQPRVLTASYGDGYTQRVAAGINNIQEGWNLTWKNRTTADANKIVRFLEIAGGVTAFDWYPEPYAIESVTTGAATSKLIDTTQHFTSRVLNTTVTDTGGSGATATSAITYGAVSSITITAGGVGYNSSNPPTISITGGGGSGAVASVSSISSASVASISITSAGSGYTSAPIVTINANATAATVTNVDSATQLSLSSNIMATSEAYTIYPYKKYVCEKWTSKDDISGYRTITAEFKKVFEP